MVVNLIKMDFPQFSIFQTNKITHVKSTVLLNLENLLPVLFFRLFSINIDRNPLVRSVSTLLYIPVLFSGSAFPYLPASPYFSPFCPPAPKKAMTHPFGRALTKLIQPLDLFWNN